MNALTLADTHASFLFKGLEEFSIQQQNDMKFFSSRLNNQFIKEWAGLQDS